MICIEICIPHCDDYAEEETGSTSNDSDDTVAGAGVVGAAGSGGAVAARSGSGESSDPVKDSTEGKEQSDGPEEDDCEAPTEVQEPEPEPDDHDIKRDEQEERDDSEDRDDRDNSRDDEKNNESEEECEDEQEEERDEEQEDEEEEDDDDTVVIVQEVDPLSAMSWGVQPVMKEIEARYGNQVEINYTSATVREFDPEQAKQRWVESTDDHEMPVDASFWGANSPESTALVNRGFEAATKQGQTATEDYLRTLWMHAIADGQSIEGEETLIDLAADAGLNVDQFTNDLKEAIIDDDGEHRELPFTRMATRAGPILRTGRIYYSE